MEAKGQAIDCSGSGAHRQGGAAERAAQAVAGWARAALLHAATHWPDQADLELWPLALECAVCLWSSALSKGSLLAPAELLASAKLGSRKRLHRARVFGCPVRVLDPKLQDGKKLPKWSPWPPARGALARQAEESEAGAPAAELEPVLRDELEAIFDDDKIRNTGEAHYRCVLESFDSPEKGGLAPPGALRELASGKQEGQAPLSRRGTELIQKFINSKCPKKLAAPR